MKIFAHDNAGNRLITEVPDDNIWIEVERADGVQVYVGSLFFEQKADASIDVSWGSIRNGTEWWEETPKVTVPAAELTLPTEAKAWPA